MIDVQAGEQFIPMNREITAAPRREPALYDAPTGHIKGCIHVVMLLWIIQMPLYDLLAGVNFRSPQVSPAWSWSLGWSQGDWGTFCAERLERLLWHAPTETRRTMLQLDKEPASLIKESFLPVTNYSEQSNFRALKRERDHSALRMCLNSTYMSS